MSDANIGDRVLFSRNGYDGHGIITHIDDMQEATIAVNVSLNSPQTFAYFHIDELTVKNM